MSLNDNKINEGSQNNDGEIDLKEILLLLAKLLKKMRSGIRYIFNNLLETLITVLLFMKKSLLYLAIGAVIGAGGFILLKKMKAEVFHYQMVLSPVNGSGVQLYNQINHANYLLDNGDLKELSTLLKVEEANLKNVKSFGIEPVRNQNNLVYDYLKTASGLKTAELDSTYLATIKLEDYIEELKDSDYKNHEITIETSSKLVDTKSVEQGFLNSLIESDFIKKIRDENIALLESSRSRTLNTIGRIDSLVVSKTNSINSENGITMEVVNPFAAKKEADNDIEYFNKLEEISAKIDQYDRSILKEKNVINVISNLKLLTPVESKYTFFIAMFGGMFIVFIGILLNKLNTFLVIEDKKRSLK